MAQRARDGGVRMHRMYGMAQRARDGGVRMHRMYGQIFAPRQPLLRCSNKLHPCNDAISALPPSVVVVWHKEPGMTVCVGTYAIL